MTAFLKLTNGLLTANYKLNRDMSHYRPLTACNLDRKQTGGRIWTSHLCNLHQAALHFNIWTCLCRFGWTGNSMYE